LFATPEDEHKTSLLKIGLDLYLKLLKTLYTDCQDIKKKDILLLLVTGLLFDILCLLPKRAKYNRSMIIFIQILLRNSVTLKMKEIITKFGAY
jgi:hypothetical protein